MTDSADAVAHLGAANKSYTAPAVKLARRFKASFFNVDDVILYGKYKNKKGRILSFGQDAKGNPTVTLEPVPKGRKQNKTMTLFKIWKMPKPVEEKQAMDLTRRIVARYKSAGVENLAFRVATRFAAMDSAKMEALLQKIRKGATATLTWAQLGEVFAVLEPGWKLEKTVGLVQMWGNSSDNRPDSPDTFWEENEAEVQKRHKELEKDVVSSPPANPKHGKLYVAYLGDVRPTVSRGGGFEFQFRLWLGNEAWKISTPDGKEKIIIPERFSGVGDFRHGYRPIKYAKLPIYDATGWLNKETKWKDQINAKLGTEPHEVVLRTRDGTGSCPVCFQNIKITNGQDIVLHGYKRPGTGQAHGSCFGVGYPAFELNVKGTKVYLDSLRAQLMGAEGEVKKLKDGHVVELPFMRGSHNRGMVKPGDKDWDIVLKNAIDEAEGTVDTLEGYVKAYGELVQKWEPRDLPKEGDRHIDWFFKGRE